MSHLTKTIADAYQVYAPKALGGKRSRKWPKTRKAFMKTEGNDVCAGCGTKKKLQVHHIVPFSVDPILELSFYNLLTLCMGFCNCHSTFGHLGSWRSYNLDVEKDVKRFRDKVENRP